RRSNLKAASESGHRGRGRPASDRCGGAWPTPGCPACDSGRAESLQQDNRANREDRTTALRGRSQSSDGRKYKVRSTKCGVRSAKKSAKCEVRSAELKNRTFPNFELRTLHFALFPALRTPYSVLRTCFQAPETRSALIVV